MADQHEVRARRTDPWLWVAVVAVAALLVLLIVWIVAARSPETEEQVRTPATDQERLRDADDRDRLIIRDREHVREVVRERPVYVYVERPEADAADRMPREVVVVPRDTTQPGTQYERVDVPARFSLNDREWIIEPGRPIRAEPDRFVSTGQQVEGQTIYQEAGAVAPLDEVYVRLRPDDDIYVRYEPAR